MTNTVEIYIFFTTQWRDKQRHVTRFSKGWLIGVGIRLLTVFLAHM